MPDSSVSSCVLNILSSFSDSLDLVTKLRENRCKRRMIRRRNRNVELEEQRLSKSLRQGPDDIGREYQKNALAAGPQFDIGDVIAQTSLAEIMIRLNLGLVGIIRTFLDSKKKDVELDYQSLTDLSERSRIDTCSTLRQLYKRMTQLRLPPAKKTKARNDHTDRKHSKDSDVSAAKKRHRRSPPPYTKVKGPMIARVVIQDSSKPSQIAMVKPGERRKKPRASKSSSDVSSTSHSMPLRTPPPQYESQDLDRPTAYRSNTDSDMSSLIHKRSAHNIGGQTPQHFGDPLRATRSTPRLQSTLHGQASDMDPLPPLPNTAPLPVTPTLAQEQTPTLPRRRKPTPTYYSIASASTKLGEIPLHKWPEPYDFDRMSLLNREAERNGWPLVPQQPKDSMKSRGGKKGGGLFRWLRRV